MARNLERLSAVLAPMLVVSALLACKKKEEAPPTVAAPSAEPAAPAPPEPAPAPTAEAPSGSKDVTRYGDKERVESGTVRINVALVKVYSEADSSGEPIAQLGRGTLVNRKARYGNWMLIEYPSGVGQLSPGWVPAAMTSTKVEKVDPTAVAQQDAGALPPPATTASASATATGTAAATPDAGATPTATATSTGTAVATATTTTPPATTTAPPATATATTISGAKPVLTFRPPPKAPPKPGSN